MSTIILLNRQSGVQNHHLLIQKIVLEKYLNDHSHTIFQLNDFQVEKFYTIPHALLHDLQKVKQEPLDCLLIYSVESIERFVSIYPEKWLMICTYFHDIQTIIGPQFHSELKAWRYYL